MTELGEALRAARRAQSCLLLAPAFRAQPGPQHDRGTTRVTRSGKLNHARGASLVLGQLDQPLDFVLGVAQRQHRPNDSPLVWVPLVPSYEMHLLKPRELARRLFKELQRGLRRISAYHPVKVMPLDPQPVPVRNQDLTGHWSAPENSDRSSTTEDVVTMRLAAG